MLGDICDGGKLRIMGYDIAVNMAWDALREKGIERSDVTFLGMKLVVDVAMRKIEVVSGEMTLKDYHQVLILHYLENEGQVETTANDTWVSFKELPGGEIYFPAFHKRAVAPLLRKFGSDVHSVIPATERLGAERIEFGTVGVAVAPLEKIRVGIVLWEEDDEFPPECNILFNESIKKILPTEDIAVLAGMIAWSI